MIPQIVIVLLLDTVDYDNIPNYKDEYNFFLFCLSAVAQAQRRTRNKRRSFSCAKTFVKLYWRAGIVPLFSGMIRQNHCITGDVNKANDYQPLELYST